MFFIKIILETIIEFEKVKFEVQETDKFLSLPIIRKGDLSNEIQVECLTLDDLATQNFDLRGATKILIENHYIYLS